MGIRPTKLHPEAWYTGYKSFWAGDPIEQALGVPEGRREEFIKGWNAGLADSQDKEST